MRTLREVIQDTKGAIGHFNIANIEMFWAVVHASRELKLPVVIGVSEGERDFFGIEQLVGLIKQLQANGEEIYSNADHTYSLDRVKEAIDADFDMVIFDGLKVSPDENRVIAKECVLYAQKSGKRVLVEAELGFIGSGSKLLDEIPEGAVITNEFMTKAEEAKLFIDETGVDLLAPAVGNLHGILKNAKNPRLGIDRIKEISGVVDVPLVLHGGSGVSDEDFISAIQAGIKMIHISTELRVAYRSAIEKTIKNNPDEVAPYRLMKPVVESVQEVVEEKMRLFTGLQKMSNML